MKASSDMAETLSWKAYLVPFMEVLEPQSVFNEAMLLTFFLIHILLKLILSD